VAGGRPGLLTPEIIEDCRRLLPTVMYLDSVAAYLGVHRTTFRKWLQRGAKEARRLRRPGAEPEPQPQPEPEPAEAIYLEFFYAYKKALADGEIRDAGVIRKAGEDQYDDDGKLVRKGEWQAAAWRLERRFPRQWGRREVTVKGDRKNPLTVEHTGKVEHEHTTLTPEDVVAARGLLGMAGGDVPADGGQEPVDP